MSKIKCIENYKELKEMLINGEKGDANFFSLKLNISNRTFHRLIKYLKDIEELNITYNKIEKIYYCNQTPNLE